jgi:nucleotide-binding universal stress UspA family protein
MFRDLLVHVDGEEAGRRRVQLAFDLAVRMGGRLSGLHVTPPAEVPPRYKPSRVPEVADAISSQLALGARAAAAIFREEAARHMIGTSWHEAVGDVVERVSVKARYADLVILGQYEWQGPPESRPLPIAHSVVVHCGRPVLVVPAAVQLRAFQRIAVAWDGSREAVRAVHDALPFLRLSGEVHMVSMIHPSAADDQVDAKSLSAHLANHGINVATEILQIATDKEPALLRNHIEHGQYDLLVMGGYSQPLWLEFIFGGVSQSLLLSSTIPILVSH